MTDKHLFIFGYGYSAQEIARQASGRFDRISGTNRTVNADSDKTNVPVERLQFDGIAAEPSVVAALASVTHLVVSIAPDENGDAVLNAFDEILANCKKLEWIGYLSTVGVYGDHGGEWVDEDSACFPVSRRSQWRLAAEARWQAFALKNELPLAIFRLSGIYGPGRNAFMNIEKGTSRRLVKKGQVFNRIHREDIGQAVNLAMAENHAGIFNITDDEPAPPQDVVAYAHELYGKEAPPEIDFERADISPMARSFYGENKRVSNQKSKENLGVVYRYPNYRVALDKMWADENWR